MIVMAISGRNLSYTVAGTFMCYAAIKNYTLPSVIQAALIGKIGGTSNTSDSLISTAAASADTGGSASGSAIVSAAESYVGHKYVYGGPSNPTGGWDCSSFVSYILGSVGVPIPGGTWATVTNNGQSHGPAADAYETWTGATTVPAGSVQPGDLLVWQTHVGFAVDSTHMISALDAASGTRISGWDGPGGEGSPVVRSIDAVAVTASASGASGGSAATNQALAKGIIEANPSYKGWDTGQTWSDLVSLWNKESGWSATAKNPMSGAYGIPQALPPTKMPTAAQAPTSNPSSQIEWGLAYIQGQYGSPVMAWQHELANNWY